MPKVFRTGGLSLSDDVVKIRDLCPVGPAAQPKPKPKPKPRPRPASDEDGGDGLLLDGEELELEPGEGFQEPGEEFEEEAFDEGGYEEPPPAGGGGIAAGAIKEEIIQAAMAEAGRILEDAVHQGEAQRQEILGQIQQEADQIRAQAEQQGRADGYSQMMEEAQRIAAGVEDAVARFEGERAGFEAEYEEQMKWMAMEIASKVLAKKVAEDDAELLEMVDKAVQSVRAESWIRIEVAQEMVHLIDRLSTLYEGQQHIDVSAVPAAPGSIQIETPSGVVDASLKTQLENLKGYFASGV